MDFSIPTSTRLKNLHAQLPQSPHSSARVFIDTHLLACFVDPLNPPSQFILDPINAYHYNNLPDLTQHLRKHLVENTWEADVLGGFMAPFCLHINRTLRPHNEPSSNHLTRAATLNLLHGLLLGLYPFNVRHPAFLRRVALAGTLRSLMCSSVQDQLSFIRGHERLLTLSMMEYLANVVVDYCPVEEALLIRTPQCRAVVNHLCDAFRVAVGDEETLQWDAMEAQATQTLLSVQRQLKLCNIRPCKRSGPRVNAQTLTPTLIATALESAIIPVSTPNLVAQIQLLHPSLSFQEIQAVEFLWSNITLHPLPRTICVNQLIRLARFESCSHLKRAVQILRICVTCALGTKKCILQHKCSLQCITSKLLCTTCKHEMQEIHMVGRVLTVRQTSYFLCPKCLRPTPWTGTFESCQHCLQSLPQHQAETCHICENRHVATLYQVVDYHTLSMHPVPLCHKHARACVTSAVYDIKALEADLFAVSNKK